jgi:ABC-type phosphate/phosphonate transport system substrate-binding protein
VLIGVHDNLVPRDQRKRAVVALDEMVELIGQRLKISVEARILPSETQADLLQTAAALRDGRIHVVAMSVQEYNWLRAMVGDRVDILAVADPGVQNVMQYEQVIVRADRIRNLAQLRGKILAQYDQPMPSARIYLHRLQVKFGPEFLDRKTPMLPTPMKALDAVFSREADAAIVDLMVSRDYEQAYPGKMAKLNTIDRSPNYPVVPVVGNPQAIEKLGAGLWERLRVELTQVHTQPRADAFFEHWRARLFLAPSPDYRKKVDEAAREYPRHELSIGLPH